MFLFVSCYSFCCKIYFIWYRYYYSSFLIILICVLHFFPIPSLVLCVRIEVSPLWIHTHTHMCACVCVYIYICLVSQSCPTHVTPWTVACQAPLSMGILHARILECVAMPSSRGSSQPRDQIQVSQSAGEFFTIWATREALVCIHISQVGLRKHHYE